MDLTQVILVDEQDNALGSCEKMEAHRKGLLHRAFSVFVFNRKGEMLLQRRSDKKYHSAGLWTNACCSHPAPGEELLASAELRLLEEMGIHTPLSPLFSFIYKVSFENGLTEYEFDHVFTGVYFGDIRPDPDEVSDYCFQPLEQIRDSMLSHPHKYTEWFKIAFPRLMEFRSGLSAA